MTPSPDQHCNHVSGLGHCVLHQTLNRKRLLTLNGVHSLGRVADKMTKERNSTTSQISIISNYLLIAPLGFRDLALEFPLKVQSGKTNFMLKCLNNTAELPRKSPHWGKGRQMNIWMRIMFVYINRNVCSDFFHDYCKAVYSVNIIDLGGLQSRAKAWIVSPLHCHRRFT